MDLEVKDVAALLSVSEETVEKWVTRDEIPSYRMQEKIRFSRVEIENWMLRRQQAGKSLFEEEDVQSGGRKQFALYRSLNRGGVLSHILGKTKQEVIRSSLRAIAPTAGFDAESMGELFLEREELMPTALGNGVAVPHTRDFLIEPTDLITIVYPETPLDYGSLDGEKVHTLFFLFAASDKMHLYLLSKISYFVVNPEALALLKRKASREELLPFIKQWEGAMRS